MRNERTARGLFLRISPVLGVAGSCVVTAVVVIVAFTYSGRHGEAYSILNHFISELGQRGVSRNAWLFNAGLIVGGLFFVPFCVGIGALLDSWIGWVATGAGIAAGALCAGVGIFPMNGMAAHIFVAMWFFRFGLLTTLLFGVSILAQRRARVSRWASLISLVAVAAYAGFLIIAPLQGVSGGTGLDPGFADSRPRVWVLAVSEWAVFAATILWFAGVGLLLRFGVPRSAIPSGTTTERR